MRVIAGELRGRRLVAPAGLAIRPTSDRLRETLFNILAPVLPGARFVDAFAGSGAVGIEAWSRGARPVAWLECAPPALASLQRNLRELGLDTGGVVAGPARDGIRRLVRGAAGFGAASCDIFFLDPPYDDDGEYQRTLRDLLASGLLADGGLVIAEARRHAIAPEFPGLRLERTHPQGDSVLWFFRAVAAHSTLNPAASSRP